MSDVDECIIQPIGFNCTRNHTCINTDGSYGCMCKPGYGGTALSCMGEFNMIVIKYPLPIIISARPWTLLLLLWFPDIDECQHQSDECEQVCINTPGSYTCDCVHGYMLNSDGRRCDGQCTQ